MTGSGTNNYIDPQAPIFTIVGIGEANLYSLTWQGPYIAEQSEAFGFLEVQVKEGGTTLKAIFHANDGTVKDRFTINKSFVRNHAPIANHLQRSS